MSARPSMLSKINLRYVTNVEPSRNGNALLVAYLRSYFGKTFFKFCEFYTCCQSAPCVHQNTIFQRNHDFELNVNIEPDAQYLLQFRHPLHSLVSHFEYRVNRGLLSDTSKSWISHAAEWLRFFQAFVAKWIINNEYANIQIVTYVEILSDPVNAVADVIRYLAPDHNPEPERLNNLVKSVNVKPVRDPRTFRYYDPLHFALMETEILDLLPLIRQAPQFVPAVDVLDQGANVALADLETGRDYYLLKLELIEPEVRQRVLWNTQDRFNDIIAAKDNTIDGLQKNNVRLLRENLELKGTVPSVSSSIRCV
jgi:hypothetical protein